MLPSTSPIYSYTYDLRSRYAETDKMGYVYYGRYLEYFEVARTEMIRELGMPYSDLEHKGIMLPVVQAQVDYKAPVYYDELMHIHVHLYSIPAVKLETYYELCTERESSPHAIGSVTLCFMKEENRKPCRAPQQFIEGLKNAID
ncbi:acyl-CoA thioesterase [Aliifodinibius sp. S!AR15-10]|uniref:acyl-CoA thioesterase n=1 Tax=Aliifodinibius sp. S!AR15-10 TaxID=2950437 RepID=UPI00286414F2|nr:thioesterase family protein [Aliifodinibius sp. S!AR15-10]MDR8393081.1 acyl-CoA thioesterase [Aliifodinibius sp. S!AR15-10]